MKYYNCYVQNVNKLLTYQGETEIGSWVEVPYRVSYKKALVVEEVPKPSFKALDIHQVFDLPKSKLIPLIKWMIQYYFLNINEAFSLIFPKNIFKDRIHYKKLVDLDFFTKETLSREVLLKKVGLKGLEELLKAGEIEECIKTSLRSSSVVLDSNTKHLTLSQEQQNIVNKINQVDHSLFLLQGVTGSGKTEVYAELAKYGKTLILVPEIALANEIAKKLSNRVKNVVIVHSSQTEKELGEAWLNAASGEAQVVIGTRSAIFAPIDAKYIIIDEEHEDSYKQSNKPFYDARAVAMKRALLFNAKLVLGSATPSLERYYYSQQGKIIHCELKNRYNNYSMPEVEVINMQSSRDILSKKAVAALQDTIAKGEQAIVVINKRGYGSTLQCNVCGQHEECINCSVSMIYFKSTSSLRCAYCDYERRVDNMCSKCGAFSKEPIGKGSEKIEEELKKIDENVIRFDGDINKIKNASKELFEKFKNNEAKILVGTKLVAKGLDFPNVTLVLIVEADSVLHFPDFRAAERTYQFIWQAAGRAGRSNLDSKVLIQTYNPEHYVFKLRDYKDFYNEEISFRKELGYPPFGKSINIIVKEDSEEKAEAKIKKVAKILQKKKIESYPPNKAFVYRVQDKYRYHIFIKESKKKNIDLDEIKNIKNVFIDVDPVNLI